MSITSEQLSQLTSRAGVARAGTARSGVAAPASELKPSSEEIIWNRAAAFDGNPDDTPATYTTGRG